MTLAERTMASRILVVEDEAPIRDVIEELVTTVGHDVVAVGSAEAALVSLDTRVPDLIITDVHMSAMNGVELCKTLKADPRFQLTPIIVLTGVTDVEARVAALAAGADDFFAKPVDPTELRTRVGVLLRVKGLVDQLDRAEAVITTLGATIEARDPYTGGHCERLARYAVALGQAFGVDERTLKALQIGGYLYDLGKVAVPDAILLKAGPLDADERRRIKAHPVVGAELVATLRTLDEVRLIIRHHHERWDGSGYPDRLGGESIPLGARLMAVVDVYDALSTDRPYRKRLPRDECVSILRRESEAGSWDPRVARMFFDVLKEGSFG